MKIGKITTSEGIHGFTIEDPQLRFTPVGHPVATLYITVNGEVQRWEAWDELAEKIAEHLTRGRKVTCHGRQASREWVNRDGEKITQQYWTARDMSW